MQKHNGKSKSPLTRIRQGSQAGGQKTRAMIEFVKRHARQFERETGLHLSHA